MKNPPPARFRHSPFRVVSRWMGDPRTVTVTLGFAIVQMARVAVEAHDTLFVGAALAAAFILGAFVESTEPFARWSVHVQGSPPLPPGFELPSGAIPFVDQEVSRWGTKRKAEAFVKYMENEGLPPGMQVKVQRR